MEDKTETQQTPHSSDPPQAETLLPQTTIAMQRAGADGVPDRLGSGAERAGIVTVEGPRGSLTSIHGAREIANSAMREAMLRGLAGLTGPQNQLFSRIFGSEVPDSRLEQACDLIQRTLRKNEAASTAEVADHVLD